MWIFLVLFFSTAPLAAERPAAASTCVACHKEFDGPEGEPARLAAKDVHFEKGLSCHSCHGGDPTVEDADGSMSRAKGYIGRPARKQVVALCGSCHSNLDVMRRYNPQARVDQQTEYLTSVHGKKYVQGDAKVATCIECHGAHGIRAVRDPQSPVYPTNVAATCGRCHSDAGRMASYGIPTNQVALYTGSVHGEALIGRRDISAPTCNDCHGNHGARPPGVDSVANVCGQCHVSQWDLFTKSPHQKGFAENQLPACVSCHDHHKITRTSDAMLGVDDAALCGQCHDPGSSGYKAAAQMKKGIVELERRLDGARSLLVRAERAGMEVSRPVFELAEGRDRLVRARVEVHRFDAGELQKVLDEGLKIAGNADASGNGALAELAYRRKGLAVSVVLIVALMGLVVAKIRDIER